MDKDKLKKINHLLVAMADVFNRKMKPSTIVLMAKILGKQKATPERWEVVIDHAIETCEFMPTVAKLIEIHETIPNPEKSRMARDVEKWLVDHNWQPSGSFPQKIIDEALVEMEHAPGSIVSKDLWS